MDRGVLKCDNQERPADVVVVPWRADLDSEVRKGRRLVWFKAGRFVTAVLGIETSCDETSAAVVVDGHQVLSNVVASQVNLHAKYGGVVPEIAARAHIEQLDLVLEEALNRSGIETEGLDVVAVTNRPGLVGSLLVGVTAAKTLAWAWRRPLVDVDHVQAHAYSAALGSSRVPWPAVGLVVSGGHTSLFFIDGPTRMSVLGATTDDSAGEAFDKVATILGLGYPGGPMIDRIARTGNPKAVAFPRTMLSADSLDFSFSGIKTAVLYHVHGRGRTEGGLERLSESARADLAASFQQAVIDVLVRKTMLAVAQTGLGTVVLGGGVAANSQLRSQLEAACDEQRIQLLIASMEYCTDNAAMIAGLGFHRFREGRRAMLSLDAASGSELLSSRS